MNITYTNGDFVYTSEEFPSNDSVQPGTILEATRSFVTWGGEYYTPGDKLEVIERTDERPYNHSASTGNFKVRGKNREITIWSTIEYCLHLGWMKIDGQNT